MDNNINAQIGKRLTQLRKKSNMNQSQVAEILDIKRETYASWEIGRSGPKNEALVKIAKLYNVSIEYILTGQTNDSFVLQNNNNYNDDIYADSYVNELSTYEKTVLMKIRMLNLNDKQKVAEFINDLKHE